MDARREEYITAMDNIIRLKVPEVLEFFGNGLKTNARILDVGAGSGAFALGFLEQFEDAQATLLDIRQVLPQTQKLVEKSSLRDKSRVLFHEDVYKRQIHLMLNFNTNLSGIQKRWNHI